MTGSVGKTTMLHLLEIQLGDRAHYSHNANSAYGIAFDIVGLRGITDSKWRWLYLMAAVPFRSLWFRHGEEFYVVEIDGERPRETEFLAGWLKPEVTLWVSLGRSHAVYFDNQVRQGLFETVDQAIAHEFGFLPRSTSNLVIADGDNPLITKQLEGISAEVQLVQLGDLKSYQVWPERSQFGLKNSTISFSCPMPRQVAVQLLILERLADYLELPLVEDFADYRPAPGRNSFFKGKNGLKLIDSSYNAHLISMKSIFDMAEQMQADHKWLVIGDIIEQGESEAEQHQKLGEEMAKVKAEKYVLVGRRTKKHTLPALEAAGLADKVQAFDKATEALDYLEGELKGQETVIFKGSQYLEWIVEKLLVDPQDVAKLPRQEPSARRRREAWGLK